ncbi:MAG: hypothetical protein ACKOWJ_05535 [Micrococcales bacterium]
MIRLLQLFPEHLDLNGDAGNLLVLQRRAEWGGIAVVRDTLAISGQPGHRPDVVLVGHGSAAAWRQAYPALKNLVPTLDQWMADGTQVLAISSGFAALHGLFSNLPATVDRHDERFSNFVVESFHGQPLVGYKNSDLQLANLMIDGRVYGSLLHGPLLAKNAWLADRILGEIIVQRPELKENRSPMHAERFSQVSTLAKAAIELATEIAAD